MSDVFREVDEDVRRERASQIWSRYGTAIVIAAVLIVAVVGGWRVYEFRRDAQAEALGDRFAAAIALAEGADEDAAARAQAQFIALSDEAGGEYETATRFAAAAEAAKRGARDDAEAAYRAVIESADGALRDAARIRLGYLLSDTASGDDLIALLAETTTPQNAFYLSSQEILGLNALANDELATAREYLLSVISAPAAPTGLNSRAEILLDLIAGSGGAAPNAEPLPEAPSNGASDLSPLLQTPVLTAPSAPSLAPSLAPSAPTGDAPIDEAQPAATDSETTQ